MEDRSQLVVAIGKADVCELFSRAFTFPDEELVLALADGSFAGDCISCLVDAGCESVGISDAIAGLALEPCVADGLLGRMRKEYSHLYLNPAQVLVYPYESAFLHTESGREGIPVLFRSAATLDVESQMREAGVVPKNVRKEPCDSIFQELEFMSFMYGSLASAIQQDDGETSALWQRRIDRFLDEHALKWMPLFMERTVDHSSGGIYSSFAKVALAFFDVLSDEAAGSEKVIV